MRYIPLVLCICVGGSIAQIPRIPPPWGQGIQMGKPNRPSPFGSSSGLSNNPPQYDDPIPSNSRLDSTYDTQQLPAKLPILAPNGVVEIYNRVVDDLLDRLRTDFRKREIDPMDVVIRPTPGGPVRVPGHLQKRPFRRPGAALYRTGLPFSVVPIPPGKKPPGVTPKVGPKSPKRKSRSADDLPPSTRFPADRPQVSSGEEKVEKVVEIVAAQDSNSKPSFRGAGKISKTPLTEDDEKDSFLPETTTTPSTTTTAAPENKTSTAAAPEEVDDSSEEDEPFFSRARSDEYTNNEDELDLDLEAALDENLEMESKKAVNKKTTGKREGTEEEEDDDDVKDKLEGSKDVETLLQKYQSKNTDKASTAEAGHKKQKYNKKKAEEKSKTKQKLKEKEASQEIILDEDDEDDFDNSDSRDEDDDDVMPPGGPLYHDGLEPGTLQSAGNRPAGGYYGSGGPPPVPAKPNAQLTGLSRIRRASDVSVSVDARSAVITARLLVGPLNVVINNSVEPLERNVRATIPELEAELLLMERHGVVFLQRFTLDRAYGQDVEISIPKSKGDTNKKKKIVMNKLSGGGPPADANTNAQQRYQTKMAAHVSMEIVKLLRSGNLRVNLMRTAQSSMSKLKLPIKKAKKSKKSKKNDKAKSSANKNDNDE